MADKSKQQNTEKLVVAKALHLRIAPRKMRLVTNLVKGMNATIAIQQLIHTNKKAAPMLIKVIKSAIANAKNNFSMDDEKLFIKTATCNMGKVMKRFMPRARGSASPLLRKMSHVTVVLEERKGSKAVKSKFSLFKKKAESEVSPDQTEATNIKPEKVEGKKSQVFKTEEQMKQSKVQQKRRLFNRKTGE